ncbi:hypothetical protein AVEN_275535-1, partial [Araneus ventricosus]
ENLRRNRRTTPQCFSDQAPRYKKEEKGTSGNGHKIQDVKQLLLSQQQGEEESNLVSRIIRILPGG